MKLYEKDNLVILEEIENFDAKAIFTCGQAFRWYEESDGSFTTVHLGRVLNVLGIVITIVELEEAAEKSIEKESPKPIVAESIRQAGGWSGALITATAWGSYAAASTSISGPWAIVIGFAASLVGGFLGYFFSDKVADHIDEN